MITDEQIKSEMLAEAFIQTVNVARRHLEQGEVGLCLSMLLEIENSMQVLLALGELDDIEQGTCNMH